MLFQSAEYLLFLPICVAIYWISPKYWRVHLLMVMGYIFYATWSPAYAVLMFGLVLMNWYGASCVRRYPVIRRWITLSLIAGDLAVLGLFKYYEFFINNLNILGVFTVGHNVLPGTLQLALPLGISFFTFEFIHFLVDTRRGTMPTMRFSEFHVFASFFPTQIAGPIKRFQDFLPQIDRSAHLSFEEAAQAIEWIALGLFKKAVLADRLGIVVDRAFENPHALSTVDAWVAILAFAFQIYFDFSGYTDIARGSGLLFGFHIPINFNHPYLARNVSDFWKRWHISLSQWLRDYLFIPLGGSRNGQWCTIASLMITMVLGGLWHGAGWNFVAWGAYWGLALVAYHQWRRVRSRIPVTLGRLVGYPLIAGGVTLIVVLFSWALFRLPLSEAMIVLQRMVVPTGSAFGNVRVALLVGAIVGGYYALCLLRSYVPQRRGQPVAVLQGAWCALLIVGSVVLAVPSTRAFIYFQF